MNKIKVLIVDDSALVRQILTEILSSDDALEVVGAAPDPLIARDKIKSLNPDVLTLDVEMPRMDGVTFLRNLMRLRPMPVVMVSSLTEQGADITFEALEIGAVDFVTKPKLDVAQGIDDYADEIIEKVKVAAGARIRPYSASRASRGMSVEAKNSADVILNKTVGVKPFKTTERIIAIGASTGGTEAIRVVLEQMPPDLPGLVITQHIPEKFSASFAKRMDSLSALKICEARDGQQILRGHGYISPGNRHLLVVRDGARYVCRLHDGPVVNRHKPSVDVLFRSVATDVGANAIGVILTGMGDDGARGMMEMHEAGAPTLAQDEKTSVVWGMPGEAVQLGGVDSVLPLEKIAEEILNLLTRRSVSGSAPLRAMNA